MERQLLEWKPPTTSEDQDLLNAGLLSELDKYREGRDKVAPYVASIPISVQKRELPTLELVHRAVVISGVAGGVYLAGVVVVSVGSAVIAFVSANAAIIGGGALCFSLLFSFAFGLRGSDKGPSSPPPNDEYEFYQEQRQGWRKKT